MENDKPAARQPLSATWREWIAERGAGAGHDGPLAEFDAIVVGSGYGGSVAALRLAEKGYRTLVLERGSEYLPGEFPADFSHVLKYLRLNVPGLGVPVGRASGLVEGHAGLGLLGITGNGLGGGSLINAGVAIEPDEDVFVQPEWPAAIRHGDAAQPQDGSLARAFERAREMLDTREWTSGLADAAGVEQPLCKTAALQRLAGRLGRAGQLQPVRLTIDPERCVRCGDCVAGCNETGAKKSLASTYLARAMATGRVQIVTQAEVYRFEPRAGGGWTVHVFSTDVQHQYRATRELFDAGSPAPTVRSVGAPMLLVCAGTFGSTQLLQRSQALGAGTLAFSPALGSRLSGNGDSISFSANEAQPVNSVGRGEPGFQAWKMRAPGTAAQRAAVVGPTVTAMLDLRDRDKPLQERLLLQDGAIPRALAQPYHEILATSWTLRQLGDWCFQRPAGGRDAQLEDPMSASAGLAEHTQVLLAMGHDGSPGRMVWLDGHDQSAPYLPDAQQLPTYQAQQRLFDRIGRSHVHNPLWQPLPEAARAMMAGPQPRHTVTTVHPLGGCPMSDHPDSGVVDHLGRVWVHDLGRRLREMGDGGAVPAPDGDCVPRTYPGLYVIDGSIVPTSLGCNPLLTITALAERCMAGLPQARPGQAMPRVLASEARAPRVERGTDVPIDAKLNEVLVGRDVRVSKGLAQALGGRSAAARLSASFFMDDTLRTLRNRRHPLGMRAELVFARCDDPQGQDGPAVAYENEGGAFELLPANAGSDGPWPVIRCALELGLTIGLALLPWLGGSRVPAHWLGLWLAALVAAFLLLPLWRTALTWFILRGAQDFRERDRTRGWAQRLARAVAVAGPMLKQWVHATEKRVMRYRIRMVRRDAAGEAALRAPKEITLHGRKVIMYRASAGQLVRWLLRAARPVLGLRPRRGPVRPSFWEQVMDAQVRVVAGRRGPWAPALARGQLRMGLDNLVAGQGAPGPMQLGKNGDTSSGLLALAAYPMLFLRLVIKTRLLDFRLPRYSGLPVADNAPAQETCLRPAAGREGGDIAPELLWVTAPRGTSAHDRGDEPPEPLRLRLWRYRRRGADSLPAAPEVNCQAEWLGLPVARVKSVLLLHAFGQSGLSFTFKETGENLAEAFHRQGWEVWILETRMSTRSGYASDPCTVDQIARHDIPAGLHTITALLAQEFGGSLGGRPVQVAAFGQCIGAAALWMALLSGKLSYGEIGRGQEEGGAYLSMISHAMFSQVHPWVVGSHAAQAKTPLPGLIHALSSRATVPFAVRGAQDGWLPALLDRLLASMPVPEAENRQPQGHGDASATSKRIRFIEAPLFRHENINDATFAAMNRLFGEANVRLFTHARRFVEKQCLVDEDGVHRYVTADNIRRHLALPIQLLHGKDNELFHPSGAQRSFEGLRALHGAWQDRFAPAPLMIEGYGHLDVLIGQRATKDIYPRVLEFFERATACDAHTVPAADAGGWVLCPPKIGPFLGWVRPQGAAAAVRLSFILDDRDGAWGEAAACRVLVRRRSRDGAWHTLPPQQVSFQIWEAGTHEDAGDASGQPAAHRAAWGDVRLEQPDLEGETLQVLSLHAPGYPWPGPSLATPDPSDDQIDAFLRQAGEAAARPAPVVPDAAAGGAAGGGFGHAMVSVPGATFASLQPLDAVGFAVGCCRYPGLWLDTSRVDDSVARLLAEHQESPVAYCMLLGDQIYADATAEILDPTSPLERYYERHETAFSAPLMRRLLSSVPTYMTPDDHEWAESYPNGSPLVKEPWPDRRAGSDFRKREHRAFRVASDAVTTFQRLQSPIGASDAQAFYAFGHGCVRTFTIDTRQARQREFPLIVEPAALERLRQWLREPAAFACLNVVATGSVVLPGLRANADPANPQVSDSWQYAAAQRRQLLELLATEAPGRFLLLSGDYHVSAAMEVRLGAHAVGAAIVAPPLYAPLPYANVTPESLDIDECLQLDCGTLGLAVPAHGQAARGSGHARIDVRRTAVGFEITCRRDLWVWETGQAQQLCASIRLGNQGREFATMPAGRSSFAEGMAVDAG